MAGPVVFLGWELLDAELFTGGGGDAVRGPGRFPSEVYGDLTELWESGEAVLDFLDDLLVGRAALRGHGDVDFDFLAREHAGGVRIRRERDAVDESEFDDVDGQLGVVDIAERGEDVGFGEGSHSGSG
jgi:hypothetical protein